MALSREQRAKNLRTGLILGSVVLAFFVGVMIKTKLLGGL
ncbi:cytochrome oxidase small assembly protein [Pandoraea faecigallinarum]|nr:cytochrome oxidase small assembly protein [Pandoraea faecigallinarum]